MKKIIFTASIAFNIVFILIFVAFLLPVLILEGSPEKQNGKLGVLRSDLQIGHLQGQNSLFTLPKGLVVRDASATGMGWFEPHRFKIIVTSGTEGLVNYDVNLKEEMSEFYSADLIN